MSSEPPRSWSHTADDSRLVRALVSVPVGLVASGSLAAGIAVAGVLVLLFVEGHIAIAVAILLACTITLARVAPLTVESARERSLARGFLDLRRRWQVAAVLAGWTPVLAAGAAFGSTGSAAAFAATLVVPPLVASVLVSEGDLDEDAKTLTYRGTDVDLRTLDGFSRLALGGYVAYRLSYAAGTATFTTPRFLVVPRRVDAWLRDALEAGVAADAGDEGSPKRAVRVTAAALGVFFLGFAAVLLTVEPTTSHPRGQGVLWYAALVSVTFGVLFVGIGIRGG